MTTAKLLNPLEVRRLPDGRRMLLKPLAVDLGQSLPGLHRWAAFHRRSKNIFFSEHRTTVIRVMTGTVTNYASGPSPLVAALVGRWDRHDIASVIHDRLVELGAPPGPSADAWWIIARSGERRVNIVGGFLGRLALGLWNLFVYRPRLTRENDT